MIEVIAVIDSQIDVIRKQLREIKNPDEDYEMFKSYYELKGALQELSVLKKLLKEKKRRNEKH